MPTRIGMIPKLHNPKGIVCGVPFTTISSASRKAAPIEASGWRNQGDRSTARKVKGRIQRWVQVPLKSMWGRHQSKGASPNFSAIAVCIIAKTIDQVRKGSRKRRACPARPSVVGRTRRTSRKGRATYAMRWPGAWMENQTIPRAAANRP